MYGSDHYIIIQTTLHTNNEYDRVRFILRGCLCAKLLPKALPTFCKEHLAWFPVLPIHGIEYATGCPFAGFPRDDRVATVSDASGKIKQQRGHITVWQFWKFREGGWYGGGSGGGGLKVDGSVGWVGGWARGQRLPWRVDW